MTTTKTLAERRCLPCEGGVAALTLDQATALLPKLGSQWTLTADGKQILIDKLLPVLDDLDLDADLEQSVTIVEWGHGLAEDLSDDRLEVVLEAHPETERRTVAVTGHGDRWKDGVPC